MLFSHYKMKKLLKQFANNTEPKISFSIVVSDNKTRFKHGLNHLFNQIKRKVMKQQSSIWRRITHFQILDRSNNCFSYSPRANAPWFDIIILEGSYHVEDINEFIHRQMRKNCHYDKANDKNNIEISANTNTLKSEMIMNNNCEVDFRRYNSINSLLGFDSKLYTS